MDARIEIDEVEIVKDFITSLVLAKDDFTVRKHENLAIQLLSLFGTSLVNDEDVIGILFDAKCRAVSAVADKMQVNETGFMQGVIGGDSAGNSTRSWVISIAGGEAGIAYDAGRVFAEEHGIVWNENE